MAHELKNILHTGADKFTIDVQMGRYELPAPEVGPGPGSLFRIGDRVRSLSTYPLSRVPLVGTVEDEHVGSYGYQRLTVRWDGYKGNPVQNARATDVEHEPTTHCS